MPRGPCEILMRVLGPVLGLSVILSPRATFAQANDFARLMVDRDQGAETCFPAERLRNAVAERLGYVPFDPKGRAAVEARSG